MPIRNYFLKMVGAADWPIEDRWIDQHSDLLYGVRTPRQPRAIKSGDLLVYYAAGAQIARATQDGSNVPESAEPGEHRWPFRIPVQMYLAVPTLTMAPHWSVLGLPSTTVQQKSYVELNADQYQVAFDAIVVRARPSHTARHLPAPSASAGVAWGNQIWDRGGVGVRGQIRLFAGRSRTPVGGTRSGMRRSLARVKTVADRIQVVGHQSAHDVDDGRVP